MQKAIFFEESMNRSWVPQILKEMYIDKVYDRFLKDRKDAVILDIGANIGLFTLYAYPHASKIYAMEPAKMHFNMLKDLVTYNKMEDKVELIQKAVDIKDGTAEFFHTPNITSWGLGWGDKKKAQAEGINGEIEKEIVETITMSTLFTRYNLTHIDFMKLDVEGSETVIFGGKDFEKVCKDIDALVFESHRWNNTNPMQIVNNLRDYGYDVFPLEMQNSNVTSFGAIRE